MLKRGDIVVHLDELGGYLQTFVVKSYIRSVVDGHLHRCNMAFGFNIYTGERWRGGDWWCTRLATDDEREKFFNFLQEKSYRFNLNTLELL